MTDQNPEEKPKIIIDEDWKSQVEAEREKLKQQQAEAPPAGEGDAQGDMDQLPPASLAVLTQMLSTQALAALGQFPDPNSEGKVVVHLDYAKLQIDLLAVLKEKTAGNCTAEEAQMLDETVHQLRLLFVGVQNQIAQMVAEQQGNPPGAGGGPGGIVT